MNFLGGNVINRECANKAYLTTDACKKAEVCIDCEKDECNGAPQYGSAAIIVAIPIAIMKIFSLL